MIRRSIALSSLETCLRILIQLVGSVVLARSLTPGQIGVFATAALFAALASKVRDFGLTEYLIQLQSPTATQLSAAFTTNVIVSWCICALMFALNGPLAAMFDEPLIGEVIRLQTLAYLAVPFGAIHLAWHHRNLNFGAIVASGLALNRWAPSLARRRIVPFFLAAEGLACENDLVRMVLAFPPLDYSSITR